MAEMTDAQLKAEHKKRLAALEKARKSGGKTLRKARLAADETQALVNERFGAPPPQTIGS